MDRYWLYTAITRAREFKNVSVFIHSGREVAKLETCKLKQYINMKIEHYQKQDKEACRTIEKSKYVDYNWFEKEFNENPTCYHCQCGFELGLDEHKHVFSNISFDRIDNSLGHNKDNLALSCVNCNLKKLVIR